MRAQHYPSLGGLAPTTPSRPRWAWAATAPRPVRGFFCALNSVAHQAVNLVPCELPVCWTPALRLQTVHIADHHLLKHGLRLRFSLYFALLRHAVKLGRQTTLFFPLILINGTSRQGKDANTDNKIFQKSPRKSCSSSMFMHCSLDTQWSIETADPDMFPYKASAWRR